MQILEHRQVVRDWLGMRSHDLSPQLAQSFSLTRLRGMLVAAS